ncbi:MULTISPECIES: hypothetical protein [Aphanothece]|uniref:hypothetical protein n=1 Tax=Aphanothece TaxID=1121 RepID=UPI003985149C
MWRNEDLDRQFLERLECEDEKDRKAGIDPDPVVLKLFDENQELIHEASGSGTVRRMGSTLTVTGNVLLRQRDQISLARFCTVRGGKGQPTFWGHISGIEDSLPPRLIVRNVKEIQ